MKQGPKASALGQPREIGWGGEFRMGDTHVYLCIYVSTYIMLIYGKNHHNIVKQLFSN